MTVGLIHDLTYTILRIVCLGCDTRQISPSEQTWQNCVRFGGRICLLLHRRNSYADTSLIQKKICKDMCLHWAKTSQLCSGLIKRTDLGGKHVRCACQLPLAECTVRDVLMHLDIRAAPGHVNLLSVERWLCVFRHSLGASSSCSLGTSEEEELHLRPSSSQQRR